MSRCDAAKARREAKLKSVGLKRTFDLLRKLDDATNEACKQVSGSMRFTFGISSRGDEPAIRQPTPRTIQRRPVVDDTGIFRFRGLLVAMEAGHHGQGAFIEGPKGLQKAAGTTGQEPQAQAIVPPHVISHNAYYVNLHGR